MSGVSAVGLSCGGRRSVLPGACCCGSGLLGEPRRKGSAQLCAESTQPWLGHLGVLHVCRKVTSAPAPPTWWLCGGAEGATAGSPLLQGEHQAGTGSWQQRRVAVRCRCRMHEEAESMAQAHGIP